MSVLHTSTVSWLSLRPAALRCLGLFRYEQQLQEEEVSLQQQRRRLYKEVADEKERLAELAAR